MLPVIFRGIDIGENPRIIHRQLKPCIKITTDHGSSPLGEVIFQELWKEILAEENGVTPPPFEGWNHQGGVGCVEALDQCLNGI